MADRARLGKCFDILPHVDFFPHLSAGVEKGDGDTVGFKTTGHCHIGNDDCVHIYHQLKCIADVENSAAAFLGGLASQ